MNTSEFVTAHGFRVLAVRMSHRPEQANDWGPDARHWMMTLYRGSKGTDYQEMQTPFTQGSAHAKAPAIEDVLDCLRHDFSSVIHGESFEDFASEFGYDADSRKAERIYNACRESMFAFRKAFGHAVAEALVDSEEDES